MKFDFSIQLDTDDTNEMPETERMNLLRGFEFVHRRIKEIINSERHFDPDDNPHQIECYDDHVEVRWQWIEYGRCGDRETHYETREIPYEALFSVTAEEQHLRDKAAREEAERIERERVERERQERLRIQREAEQERKERGELARLKQKYETN